MIRINAKSLVLISILIGLSGGLIAGNGVYMSLKASFAQYLLEQAWLDSQKLGYGVPPWPWADTKPLARMEFVNLDQSFIIMEGSSGRTLAFAPGHLTGSALPGQIGHIIISAHRDTHFSVLEKIAINDTLTLQAVEGTKKHYKINEITIIDTRNEALVLEPDKAILTLITCYPFDAISANSPYRYRVDAVLLDR